MNNLTFKEKPNPLEPVSALKKFLESSDKQRVLCIATDLIAFINHRDENRDARAQFVVSFLKNNEEFKQDRDSAEVTKLLEKSFKANLIKLY